MPASVGQTGQAGPLEIVGFIMNVQSGGPIKNIPINMKLEF